MKLHFDPVSTYLFERPSFAKVAREAEPYLAAFAQAKKA